MNHKRRMSVLQTAVAVASLLCASASSGRADVPPVGEAPIVSRQEFARRALRISEDMTAAQVEAVLGKPDYIGRFKWAKNEVFWFYGCIGPLKLPSLGRVVFDDAGRIVTRPADIAWQPIGGMSDAYLRRALLLLDDMSNEEGNPAVTVRVVNALLPLGKKDILAAIAEYERIDNRTTRPNFSIEWKQPNPTVENLRKGWCWTSSVDSFGENSRLFLLRIIFDIPANPKAPPGATLPIPYPRIGVAEPAEPFDHTLFPRFPWVLLNDVPIVDLIRANLGGLAETATIALPYFEKFGRLRACPLRPTDHPEAILSDFQASPQWLVNRRYRIDSYPSDAPEYYEPDDRKSASVTQAAKEQVLAMLSPLYPRVLQVEQGGTRFAVGTDVSQWNAVMADLKIHPVRWNPKTEEYERRDNAFVEHPILPRSTSGS